MIRRPTRTLSGIRGTELDERSGVWGGAGGKVGRIDGDGGGGRGDTDSSAPSAASGPLPSKIASGRRISSLVLLRARGLWLALVALAIGVTWPQIVKRARQVVQLRRNFTGGSSPELDEDKSEATSFRVGKKQGDNAQEPVESTWQLIENSRGFHTYVAKSAKSGVLTLRGETLVDEHIGRLYTAILNTTSTLDWVRFLVEVEELPLPSTRGGFWSDDASLRPSAANAGGDWDSDIIFQRYDMPWPVRDREAVLRRDLRIDKRAKKVTATYKSVDHPARPVTSAAVRALVHRTCWVLTSLGGSKTSIEFETSVDPKGALPSAIVSFMRKKFPRDTISGFVKSARRTGIHPSMRGW